MGGSPRQAATITTARVMSTGAFKALVDVDEYVMALERGTANSAPQVAGRGATCRAPSRIKARCVAGRRTLKDWTQADENDTEMRPYRQRLQKRRKQRRSWRCVTHPSVASSASSDCARPDGAQR